MPKGLRQWLGARMVKKLVGKMSDYGLPEPEIGPFESHGTVSGEFLVRAGSGDITMKPGIERLDGDGVVFSDGSREQIDVIVWATGFALDFGWIEADTFDDKGRPRHDRGVAPVPGPSPALFSVG